MKPKQQYHQHWCIDPSVIKTMVEAADLKRSDVVFEIGPGTGLLTKELAKKCSKVIAVEIDVTLRPVQGKNVEYIVGNALEVLQQRDNFSKIVSNLPYQLAEPLFHYLCLHPKPSYLMLPVKFVNLAQQHPIFSAFLKVEIIQDVPEEAFDPEPKVQSAIVHLTQNKEENADLFIRRKLYLQRDKKLKNGLRDTIIDYSEYKGKERLTKKQADELIARMGIEQMRLEKLIKVMPVRLYKESSNHIITIK